MTKILRDGFFFRAVNEAIGFRSQAFTSASQAGRFIERKFGKDAHRSAYEDFINSLET